MIDSGLPGVEALRAACAVFGLGCDAPVLLHQRSNAVWLLPDCDVVVRLAPATDLRRQRAKTAVAVTRWLATCSAAIALHPVTGPQPVVAADAVATFWPYIPTRRLADARDLGSLTRALHAAGMPPNDLPVPRYRPLARLREALEIDRARTDSVLPGSDRDWLRQRGEELVDRFDHTQFPLGVGLVHADVHSENVVDDHGQWRLIDWDNACIGPRELDLVGCMPDHFHEPDNYRTAFARSYGYDVTAWPQWALLRDIMELHSLGTYIRLAPDSRAAAAELRRRIDSLQSGDRSVQWHSPS